VPIVAAMGATSGHGAFPTGSAARVVRGCGSGAWGSESRDPRHEMGVLRLLFRCGKRE